MKLRDKATGEIARAMALISQIGMMMTASIIAGLLVGRWLDAKLGTEPWFALGLLLLGVGGAIFGLIKVLIGFKE